MTKPKFITFTGVDLATNPKDLEAISLQYPVEWGILFSPTNTDTKYQLGNWFTKNISFRSKTQPDYMKFSAHLCGGYAREILETGKSSLDLSVFDRVQINAGDSQYRLNAKRLWDFKVSLDMKKEIIIQYRSEFPKKPKGSNPYAFTLLYDCSGGKGVVAEQFPKDPGYFVGFAGGFSPDNVLEQLAKIDCKDYYIDMEGKVRTNNEFDLEKVKSVLKQVYDR